ncbi:hypothetical protein [Brevibacillus reuszeri]|nr:hypothetical protein [Brevibacillus reuszeri]
MYNEHRKASLPQGDPLMIVGATDNGTRGFAVAGLARLQPNSP